MISETILRTVARSRRLREALALFPPSMKGASFLRIASALHRRRPGAESGSISSNLGISSRLRVELPGDADAVYTFGTPDLDRVERGALRLCRFLAQSCECFVDIGSHRGLFIFYVADAEKRPTRILFLEPETSLFQGITANLARNGIRGVVGFPLAVGDSTGPATFYVNHTDLHSSSLTTDFAAIHDIEPTTVEQITFQDLVVREGVRDALVKVDVEGAESAFLDGVRGAAQVIRYLVIEILGPAVSIGFPARAARELGMHAYYVDELRLNHSPEGRFSYVPDQLNWLFAREGPDLLRQRLAGSGFTVLG